MYRAGLVSRSTLLKGAYAQLVYLMVGADEKRMDKVKESMSVLTRGWDKQQVEEIVREALTTLIDPYIYLEAVDLMELHRALGRTGSRNGPVSSAFTSILESGRRRTSLAVDADRYYGAGFSPGTPRKTL